jgi:hypothetical protein
LDPNWRTNEQCGRKNVFDESSAANRGAAAAWLAIFATVATSLCLGAVADVLVMGRQLMGLGSGSVVDLVSEPVGVAMLAELTSQNFKADGVVIKPLSDACLCLETCVVMKVDDHSRLVNEHVRAFLRRYSSQRFPPKTESSSPSRVLNWKTTLPWST